MKKATAALIGVSSFAAGVILGFLISPVKNGFGNNNGNKSYHYYGDSWTHKLDNDPSDDFDTEIVCDCDCECYEEDDDSDDADDEESHSDFETVVEELAGEAAEVIGEVIGEVAETL